MQSVNFVLAEGANALDAVKNLQKEIARLAGESEIVNVQNIFYIPEVRTSLSHPNGYIVIVIVALIVINIVESVPVNGMHIAQA